MRYTGPSSLGQHLLINTVAIEQIIREADLAKTDKVIEIGAGEGALTSHLCKKAGQVISIEIDKAKFELAKQKLAHYKNLVLLNMSPFGHDLISFEFDVCVSNIPYSKSKETILWLINHEFKRAIIMVQKEFAKKLTSTPGNRSYRAISVICEYCFNVKELFEVTNDSFSPQPSVSSMVIRLMPSGRKLSNDTIKNIELLFSQRKRNVHKVASLFGLRPRLGASKRISQLSPNEIVDIARCMSISEA
jgi:16S rRNA (adenine1518-N6/adenine1519-N6)-dimethyltransferase